MKTKDLQARVRRLEQLVLGLTRELTAWKDEPGPLRYAEHRKYLTAIHQAVCALDRARVVLADATQRLDGGDGP